MHQLLSSSNAAKRMRRYRARLILWKALHRARAAGVAESDMEYLVAMAWSDMEHWSARRCPKRYEL